MRQITAATIALFALLSVAGCIDYAEQIVLNDDGSGTVSLYYKVASDFIPGFGKLENVERERENEDFEKQFVAEGIEITHTSVIDLNDARVYSADFKFSDDTALNTAEFYKSFSAFEIRRGKTLEYSRTISPREKSETDADAETEEKLAAMFEDNRFIFSVRMPAPVTASNGTISEDGYTVEWIYTFGEILMMDKPAKMTAECQITE